MTLPVSLASSLSQRSSRRGFTLIELLVVIAIISVLIALLLPAVQQAREAARRAECKNNLMQISLALHNYMQAHEMLPPGVVDKEGPISSVNNGYHVNWILNLLPYLEQEPAFVKFDFDKGVYDPQNQVVRAIQIRILLCPSSPFSYESKRDQPGLSNFAGCHHHTEAPIAKDNSGVLFLNSSIRYEQIPDGSSHTLFIGEKIIYENSLGWASGTRATLRNASSINDPTMREGQQRLKQPNPPNPQFVGGYGSHHAGGAHFALGDGSVRFISENIEHQVLQNLGNRADGNLMDERQF